MYELGGHSINLTVNGALSISIQLQDFGLPAPPPANGPSRSSSHSCLISSSTSNSPPTSHKQPSIPDPSTKSNKYLTQLKPFQTILLVADAEVLSMLMVGSLDPSNYSNILPHWSLRNATSAPATGMVGVSTELNSDYRLLGKFSGSSGTSGNSISASGATPETFLLSSHQQFIHPTILSYLHSAKPTISFVELSSTMNISLSEVNYSYFIHCNV